EMVGVRERPRRLVAQDLVCFSVQVSPRLRRALASRADDDLVEAPVRVKRRVVAGFGCDGWGGEEIEEGTRIRIVHFPVRLRHRGPPGPLLQREEGGIAHEFELDAKPYLGEILL